MIAARAYGIVCVGGGPRAATALRARFPGRPFRYVGPAVGAPFGVVADPSLPAALRALETEVTIVAKPSVGLDEPAAAALAAAAEPGTLIAPVLLDQGGRIAYAGSLLPLDPARERAREHALGAGVDPHALGAAPEPHAFDGRCIAAETATLRACAPERAEPEAWLSATAAARAAGIRLVRAALTVVLEPEGPVPPAAGDPRRSAAESRLAAHGGPWWSSFAADAALGRAMRTVRAYVGQDVAVVDPAPRACVVVGGEPADRPLFERALRANGLRIEQIVYAADPDAAETADRALRERGDRYVAFVDAQTGLRPGWLDALVAALECDPLAAFATFVPTGIDARATVVAAARIPACERLTAFDTLHGALADFALRTAHDRGRGVVRVRDALCTLAPVPGDAAFRARYGCTLAEADLSPVPTAPRFSGIASIVMLSWNAPEFTRMAVESIRAVTRYPHEIIVVDNGSQEATRDVLAALVAEHGIRVVYNERNLGFGQGMNVGMAHARGDVVVILNNDVLVTEGWLEDLVGALETRRTVGCTAPRSNRVASAQQLNAPYADTESMHRFAAERRVALRGRGFAIDRVVGFCLCLDRKVIEGIGGFDPRYGIGNFEDDDLCVRMRSAGWGVFVCDDVFIHHFGSASFKANAVSYAELMANNWRTFCAKWGLGEIPFSAAYDPRALARRGAADFIPLPALA